MQTALTRAVDPPGTGRALEAEPSLGMVAGVIGLVALTNSPSYVIPTFGPALKECWHLTRADLGVFYSTAAWGGAVGAVIGGICADRIQPFRTFRWAVGGMGILLLLAGVIPNVTLLWWLLTAAFCAASIVTVASMVVLQQMRPRTPRRILSANMAATAFVSSVLPLVIGWLLQPSPPAMTARFAPDQLLRVMLGMLGLALLTGALWIRLPSAPAPIREGTRALNIPKELRWFLGIAILLGTIHGATDWAFYQWVLPFFSESFTARSFPPAAMLSVYALAIFLSRSLLSTVAERRWERRLLVLPGLVGGVFFFGCIASRSYEWSAAFYTAGICSINLPYPVLLAVLARRAPAFLGITTAVIYTCMALATGPLTIAAGYFGDWTGSARSTIAIFPFGFMAFSLVAAVWIRTWPKSEPTLTRGVNGGTI